jgi:hemerythrin
MSLSWSSDLAIGVPEIDEQHQELFARAAAFLDAGSSARTDRLLDLLAQLGAYIERHFETEARLMRQHGYPGIDARLAEQGELRRTFGRLVNRFARYGEDPRVASEVEAEIIAWLGEHVSTADRELGAFLKRSIAPAAA